MASQSRSPLAEPCILCEIFARLAGSLQWRGASGTFGGHELQAAVKMAAAGDFGSGVPGIQGTAAATTGLRQVAWKGSAMAPKLNIP